MVLEICGGEASQIMLAGAIPDHRRTIDFPLSEIKRLTGLEIDDIAALTTLSRLGFSFSSEDRFAKVIPPSWRPDIEGKADLVEEITAHRRRRPGAARRPSRASSDGVPKPVLTLAQKRTRSRAGRSPRAA